MSAIFTDPTICKSFGSAYLKSRSSDSFTAALKDFVPPVAVNISNCGSVEITKTDDASPANPLKGAVFEAYKDNPTVGGTRGNEDTATGKTCTTGDDGKCTISNLLAGEYWIVETTTPAGYDTAADKHVTITADSKVTLTFVDPRQKGALSILKKSTKTGSPLVSNAGAEFSYGSKTVIDNGTGDEDSDIGEVCVSGLDSGNYTVNETKPPTGYGGASETNKTATVVAGTNCTDNQPTGSAVVTFTNPPLADIQVNFRDGGSGETSAAITCDNTTGTGSDTPATDWDTSRTVTDVHAPTTVNCKIEIDP